MTRSTNFSVPFAGRPLAVEVFGARAGLAWEAAAGAPGPPTERDDLAGELSAAPEEPDVATGAPTASPEPSLPDAGDTGEALGAELLLGFAASAACLHRPDS